MKFNKVLMLGNDPFGEFIFYSIGKGIGIRLNIKNIMELMDDCIYVSDDYLKSRTKEMLLKNKYKNYFSNEIIIDEINVDEIILSNYDYLLIMSNESICGTDINKYVNDDADLISYNEWLVKNLLE